MDGERLARLILQIKLQDDTLVMVSLEPFVHFPGIDNSVRRKCTQKKNSHLEILGRKAV